MANASNVGGTVVSRRGSSNTTGEFQDAGGMKTDLASSSSSSSAKLGFDKAVEKLSS